MLLCAVVAALSPAAAAGAAPGDLDPGFGSQGVAFITILPVVEPGFRVTIDAPPGGEIASGGQLTGTVTDTLAAVRSVKVTYAPRDGFDPGGGNADNPRTATATLTCDAGRNVCTWSVPAPPTGTWTARATATDADGRSVNSARVDFAVR